MKKYLLCLIENSTYDTTTSLFLQSYWPRRFSFSASYKYWFCRSLLEFPIRDEMRRKINTQEEAHVHLLSHKNIYDSITVCFNYFSSPVLLLKMLWRNWSLIITILLPNNSTHNTLHVELNITFNMIYLLNIR